MIHDNNCSMILLASIILSVPKIGVNGSTIVGTAEEKQDYSVTRTKMYESSPEYSPWLKNGGKINCLGDSKTCISLCCDLKEAHQYGNCVKDDSEATRTVIFIDDNHNEINITEENRHPFTNNPCAIGWMASSVRKNFRIFKNGSIFVPDVYEGPVSNLVQYCLMWDKDSHEYSARVCRPWVRHNPYELWCLTIAILIMTSIFIVYTVVPELRNFQGLLFRSYLATYIATYLCSFGVVCRAELRSNDRLFSFWENSGRYFGASTIFWLNVMSFNIWRSFRNLRSAIRHNVEGGKKLKFIWSAVYAWGSPMGFISIAAAVWRYIPYFHTDIHHEAVKQWGSVTVVTVALLCNIVLFASTALNIKRQRKDVAHLAVGVNKHYAANKQWFNLYLKLFVIMGAHIVIWPVALIRPSLVHVIVTFEVLQSILIFVIFIWKDNVIRSLRVRLNASLICIMIRRM